MSGAHTLNIFTTYTYMHILGKKHIYIYICPCVHVLVYNISIFTHTHTLHKIDDLHTNNVNIVRIVSIILLHDEGLVPGTGALSLHRSI